MPEFTGHTAHTHDVMLTLLAAAICAGCVVSAMKTLQVSLTSSNREGWRLLASGTLATGIWSAHVVAMLACSSTVSGSYSPSTTILAIVIVSLVTWSGFTLSDRASGRAEWAAVGGAIVGAGLAAMHFVGAPAMKISGTVIWNNQIGPAAVVCAVVLAAASLRSFYQMPGPRGFWIACALLFGAAASMHSIALEAQAIIPDGVVTTSAAGPDRVLLALGVAAMSLLSMGAGIAAVVVEQIRGRVQSEVVKL